MSLPGTDVAWIKAKLDTGARSSALHAYDPEEFTRDEIDWVRFGIHPWQGTDEDVVEVECPVLDRREVRSSNGQTEERLVVPMQVRLVDQVLEIEMTLSRRDEMGFRMLLGRSALEQGFLVDSSASYVGGKPPVRIRRRNRGR